MVYVYSYTAVGAVVALWFYIQMRTWARVGNAMGGSGTLRLIAMLPLAVALWPFVIVVLLGDRR